MEVGIADWFYTEGKAPSDQVLVEFRASFLEYDLEVLDIAEGDIGLGASWPILVGQIKEVGEGVATIYSLYECGKRLFNWSQHMKSKGRVAFYNAEAIRAVAIRKVWEDLDEQIESNIIRVEVTELPIVNNPNPASTEIERTVVVLFAVLVEYRHSDGSAHAKVLTYSKHGELLGESAEVEHPFS